MVEPLDQPCDLFVSYAPADHAWVEGFLLDALRAAGVRLLTQADFEPGAAWTVELERAAAQSPRVLLVLSRAYLADDRQRLLDGLARYHELKTDAASVIPLLLEDLALPLGLEAKVSLRAVTDEEKAQAIERLARACQAGPPTDADRLPCPYPGMAAFDRRNAALFHGRRREVEDLLHELRHRRCLFLIGRSGSGKSSLALAGLLPRLEEGRTVHVLRPGATPAATLAALTAGGGGRRLLVVDQFEEVYTRSEPAEASRFQEALAAWLEAPEHMLLATVRSDFYPDLQGSPAIFPLFQANHRDVLPLGPDGLREAIVAPAAGVGVFVEPALVERLLADAAGEPGVLPHLQETMQLLWERRRRRFLPLEAYQALGRQVRTGLQQAMAVAADAAVDTLKPEEQALARRTLLRLVQFGEGREDSRRQQPLAALESAADPPGSFERVLARLILRRLVVPDRVRVGATDATVIDLAHEALITGWPKLQGWVREWREAEQTRRRLEGHAAEWLRLGRGAGGLFDEIELHEAQEWLARHGQEMGATEELGALVGASREAVAAKRKAEEEAREQRVRAAEALAEVQNRRAEEQARAAAKLRRRLIATLAVGALALVCAAAAGAAALWAMHESGEAQKQKNTAEDNEKLAQAKAREANSRRLAALSRYELTNGNLDSALLLAERAVKVERTVEARGALFAAFQSSRGLRRCLERYQDRVLTLTFSPDDRTLASGNFDGSVLLWDVQSGRKIDLRQGGPGGRAGALTFSPDGKKLAAGRLGGTILLWNVDAREEPRTLKGGVWALCLAFSPGGETLTAGYEDGSVQQWDLPSGKSVLLKKGGDQVASLAFSPDGRTLIAGNYDGTVQGWDLSSGRQTPLTRHDGSVFSLAFSPDGAWLASGSWDGAVKLKNLASGAEATYRGHSASVGALAFSRDGKTLASGSADRAVKLWDLASGTNSAAFLGHGYHVTCLAFSRDGKTLASGSWDGTIKLWDPAWETAAILKGRAPWINYLAFSRDGKTLAEGRLDGSITLWERPLPKDAPYVPRLAARGAPAALSPDGKTLASGNADQTIKLWDLTSGKELPPLPRLADFARSLAFSPDGKTLASGDNSGKVTLWAWRSRTVLAHKEYGSPVMSVALDPEGATLASGCADGTIHWWDLASDKVVTLKRHSGPVISVAISPDGATLASGGSDRAIHLWVPASGKVAVLKGHSGPVMSVSFSPDGAMLASASEGVVFLWDVPGRQLLGEGADQGVSVAFSPQGGTLAVGGKDAAVRLWDVDEASWMKRVRPLVPRDFTPEERQQFLIEDQPP
jgi:WD40 repeat protein